MQELIEEASTELACQRPVGSAQGRTVELPLHRKPSGRSWIVDLSITDPSRTPTPTQGPATTPLPTFPRRLHRFRLEVRPVRLRPALPGVQGGSGPTGSCGPAQLTTISAAAARTASRDA